MHDEPTLQYTHPNNHDECHLIIGFDFGTSTSKVVIQAPDLTGHPAKAISLADIGCENASYLIPTQLWIDNKGNCSLKNKEGFKQIIDLKIKLLSSKDFRNTFRGSRKDEYPPEAVAACYIAFLLRESRHYF